MFSIWFFISVPLVGTVVLDGHCPNLAQTHYLENVTWPINLEVFVGVSFSAEHPSHLFQNINQSLSNGYVFTLELKLDANHTKLEILMAYISFKLIPISKHEGIIARASEIISIESSIYSQLKSTIRSKTISLKCHKQIKEDIRIWIDGEYVIIWSCKNGPQTHDEAVILLGSPKRKFDFGVTTENQTAFEWNIRGLKTTSSKYLTKEFLSTIDWPKVPGICEPNYNPYKCPLANFQYKGMVFVLLMLLILAVLFGTLVSLSCIHSAN